MKAFFKKTDNGALTEMTVVRALNQYPVKAVRREGVPMYTNVAVQEDWNKLTTYDVYVELVERVADFLGKCDFGLCAYLAQSIVNPMYEAVVETRTDVCDMTMIFGYDFVTFSGDTVKAETIMELLQPYITVCGFNECGKRKEIEMKLNIMS